MKTSKHCEKVLKELRKNVLSAKKMFKALRKNVKALALWHDFYLEVRTETTQYVMINYDFHWGSRGQLRR